MAHEIRGAKVASEKLPFAVQLRRYDRDSRKRLRKFVKSAPCLRDIAYSFPALAFTLANGHGCLNDRTAAVAALKDGRPLKEAAKAVGIPFWVRRLPPEAFRRPLGEIPNGPDFVRRVGNWIPSDPTQTNIWLHWTLTAHQLCDEDFAVWIARKDFSNKPDIEDATLMPLAAYGWYSRNLGHKACGFIDRPWQPNLRWHKAVGSAREWLTRCLFEYCGMGSGAFGRWSVPQRVGPYRIVPLRTSFDLNEEGRIMNNCVASYAGAVLLGSCLIYSVRRGDKHIATLEVRSDSEDQRRPFICQLLGPANREVDPPLRDAVQQWLVRQGDYPSVKSYSPTSLPLDPERWSGLWQPYFEDKAPSPSAFEPRLLQANLDALSRLA